MSRLRRRRSSKLAATLPEWEGETTQVRMVLTNAICVTVYRSLPHPRSLPRTNREQSGGDDGDAELELDMHLVSTKRKTLMRKRKGFNQKIMALGKEERRRFRTKREVYNRSRERTQTDKDTTRTRPSPCFSSRALGQGSLTFSRWWDESSLGKEVVVFTTTSSPAFSEAPLPARKS